MLEFGKKMSKDVFLLIVLLVFGYILRVWYLNDGALTFGYDQARDAYAALELINGGVKIQGPPASTPGLFHGVLYYYLLAPLYFFVDGSPIGVGYLWGFVNLIPVVLAYILGFLVSKKRSVALISALLVTVGFKQVQYSLWLSNPVPANWFILLFYVGLFISERKKYLGMILAGVGLGFAVQSNVIMIYQLLIFGLYFIAKRNVVRFRGLVTFLISFGLGMITMVLSTIKFNFTEIQGIKYLLSGEDKVLKNRSMGDTFTLFERHFGNLWNQNMLQVDQTLALGIVVLVLLWGIWQRKYFQVRIMSLGVVSMGLALSFGGGSTPYLDMGVGLIFLVLCGIFLVECVRSKFFIGAILGGIVLSNVGMVIRNNYSGQTIFSLQKDMLIRHEMQVVDYIYTESKQGDFSINSLTSPLYINVVWDYLFNYVARTQGKALPYWHGRDQIGLVGNLLVNAPENIQNRYLIIEPLYGIPERFAKDYVNWEMKYGEAISRKNFGEIVVEKRQR